MTVRTGRGEHTRGRDGVLMGAAGGRFVGDSSPSRISTILALSLGVSTPLYLHGTLLSAGTLFYLC